MDSKFDFGAMDAILEKAIKDETGQMSAIINDLIMLGRKAGKSGFTLQELATVATMGFYVSKEPELESIVQFLLSRTKPEDDYLN